MEEKSDAHLGLSAMGTNSNDTFLTPPAVTALRQEGAGLQGRGKMERTTSMDIREERQDLKEAAEQTLNVILDLGLDGFIRWVSPSWKDVIGTSQDSVQGKPIAEILLTNKTAFADAVESMKEDDSRSQIIRFSVEMGPESVLRAPSLGKPSNAEEDVDGAVDDYEPDNTLSLEAQGIMVYNRSSGGESHVSQRDESNCTLVANIIQDYVDDPSVYSTQRGDH